MRAANVLATHDYPSNLTQGAGGPLNLKAELNYDDTRSNAPIAVVMHQYSGSSGLFSNVRANALLLRDQGFFTVTVAMRGREGSEGVRDSGGLEIYDIYDAVEAVKKSYPALVNPEIVYLTGYSGGGGNTMSALTKFPDYFNAGAAFFGMSDYGYDPVDGWYFNGAGSGRQPQLRTDIGDPTRGDPDVTDRYHARASNLSSLNNPYTEIHLFVNANETICPPVNSITDRDNAVAQERYPGEFANITLHIGQSGVYEDFNDNGVNDSKEQQYWPHNAPTADQQHAAEAWFMGRLLAGQIPRPALCASGTLHVAGFVKTARFECRAGDGQQGFVRLNYGLTETNMVFGFETLSLNKQLPVTLFTDTAVFTNRRVEVWLNGALDGAFNGGGIRQTSALLDGDVLELRAAGPAVDESSLPRKLLAYYDFEAGFSDRTTNAYHGAGQKTGGAGVSFTNAVPTVLDGNSRTAAYLNGASWNSLPFLDLYGRARAGGVTVSMWVKGGAAINSWLCGEGNTANSTPCYVLGPKVDVGGKLRAFIRSDSEGTLADKLTSGAVFDAQWHHVVWCDNNGAVSLHIDGQPADVADLSYVARNITRNTTTIGALERKPADNNFPFTGWIDDVSIWSEVLDEVSVAALAAGVSPLEVAGQLSDPDQPVEITSLSGIGGEEAVLVFCGPTLALSPRPWYTTDLVAAAWLPVPGLRLSTRSGDNYTQIFALPPSASNMFFKVAY